MAAAAEAGLKAVALTDHENLDGIEQASDAARRYGIDLVAGVEVSVGSTHGPLHMLVYFLGPTGPLQDRLVGVRQERTERNHQIIIALQGLGIDIEYREVEAQARGRGIGRPHFAAVLMAKGVVPDIGSAFDRYLARGRPGYRDRPRPDLKEGVRLALESGGVPAIAHPHTIATGVDDYDAAFRDFAAAGVVGVECYYSEYAPELRAHLARVVTRLGMVPTGGSDYHGSYKPGISVGTGRGDLLVPDEALDGLRARL